MKSGSSVLQPPSDAAKRLTHPANTHTQTHTAGDAHSPDDTGSSPLQAATSLFSPDVSTKMASDLLMRLSEATQKAQVHPGRREEAEPQRLEVRGGQQDEPGLALSPDGPGASPELPSLSHTPDGGAADTLASDMLRKLAELQEVSIHGVRIKEEEVPMEVDAICDAALDQPITMEVTLPSRLFAIKMEDTGHRGNKMEEQRRNGAKMVDQHLNGLTREDTCSPGGRQPRPPSHFQLRVKTEAPAGTKMNDQLLYKPKPAGQPLPAASRAATVGQHPPGAHMEAGLHPGANMVEHVLCGPQSEEQLCSGPRAEDQYASGAKMADQYLRAILWQDMTVNLASTLLHQLSERASKPSSQLMEEAPPPLRSSPAVKLSEDTLQSAPGLTSQGHPQESRSSINRDQTFFYRCHVCGFETEGQALFQGHMTEHRQWEHGSFSLHCCVCDHSTNQEAEMRAHANTHLQGNVIGQMRCPVNPPTTSSCSPLSVAVATQPENSTSEHCCRICQRSFPGQQELLVHFQGHRQGNQYRCDRCGHLTRTANKLVEHVRVHTGERPFTCDLCPYSAKRRDSLRLHCKVKHPGDVHTQRSHVHTQRSHVHGNNQQSNKHVRRLHTLPNTPTAAPSSLPLLQPSPSDRAGWRDLSPLLPITTLISLKPRCPSSSSSSCSSSSSTKHSFLSYLGLTTSL